MVTPADALAAINYLNSQSVDAGLLAALARPAYYYDANHDGACTALAVWQKESLTLGSRLPLDGRIALPSSAAGKPSPGIAHDRFFTELETERSLPEDVLRHLEPVDCIPPFC